MRARVLCLPLCLLVAAGAGASTASPVPVSPGSITGVEAVAQSCPTFSWEAVAAASRLDLVVYRLPEGGDAGFEALGSPLIELRLPGGATSWTPALSRCFARGEQFAWSIRAVAGDRAADWAQPLLFSTPDKPTVDEVDAALEILREYRAGEDDDAPLVTAPAAVAKSVPSTALVPVAPGLAPGAEEGLFPQAEMDITGTMQADTVRLGDTGLNEIYWEMFEEANNDMTINYAAEMVRITLGGNVGIGTGPTVDELLHVGGTAQVDTLQLGDTAGNSIHWTLAEDGSNDLIFNYAGDRVKFRSNGNVGIGTAGVPAQRLEVNGIVRLTLDAAAANHVCIDAQGDLSACSSGPEIELLQRIERLESLLCTQGAQEFCAR